MVDSRYCSYWCYNDNVTWRAGGMERRGGGRWRQDDWQLLVSTLRWLRDPRLQDYYHLFQISAVLLGSQCALWWGLCDICWRGCVTDGSMVWLCSTYLLPPPAKSHHRLLPPITTTTSTNNNQYVTYQHHIDICHSGGVKLLICVVLSPNCRFMLSLLHLHCC